MTSHIHIQNTFFHYRSASVQLQTEVSSRLVEMVDQPNLLLDQSIQWANLPLFIPRLNSQPAGWQQFMFGDRGTARMLGLPELSAGEGHHLYVLATGSYAINRGQVALTAAREYELRAQRTSGATGSLTNYNQLASQPPQITPVLYTMQGSRPEGYIDALYGPWPGAVLLLKCQIPSSHKTPSVRSNLNTVTLVLSTVNVAVNPLRLTGPLSRLISHHCTCRSGSATNKACAHVMGVCIGLLAPACFQTVKKKVGRLTDISLPRAHQPSVAGNDS